MRGTFKANEIVANDKRPSACYISAFVFDQLSDNLHIAATIWVSKPYWLEKPLAK